MLLSAATAQLRERAATDATAYDFVAGLTTQIGPRLAGSANDQRARLDKAKKGQKGDGGN